MDKVFALLRRDDDVDAGKEVLDLLQDPFSGQVSIPTATGHPLASPGHAPI